MSTGIPLVELISSLRLGSAGCTRVALVMAQMHDHHAGDFSATIAEISGAAGLSAVQARKHVHTLIADGLVAVRGNAFGGAPGMGPTYSFNRRLLEYLAACNPGLFSSERLQISDAVPQEVYRLTVREAEFLAALVGEAGARRVVFWRVDGKNGSYGDVPLSVLLRDRRVRGCWHCHLAPNGNEDAPYEEMYGLEISQHSDLAAWAQNKAMGRVESMVTA